MPTPYPYINFFIILIQPAFLYCCLVLNYFQVATWSLFWTFKKNAVYKDKFKGETKNYAWLRINTHKIIFLFLKIICAKLEFGLNLLFHIIWLEIFMSVNILQRNMTYCFILSIWSFGHTFWPVPEFCHLDTSAFVLSHISQLSFFDLFNR